MDVNEAVNYFIRNAQRAQAVFLASIERPRLYDEISAIFGMPKNTFYNKEFHEKFSQTGFVRVEYFGRTPYTYAIFDDPFFVYMEKTLTLKAKGIPLELSNSFISDRIVFKEIFDSQEFRRFWDIKTLQILDKNLLRDPAYTTFLFQIFIQFIATLYGLKDEMKLRFSEAKDKAYGVLIFLSSIYSFPSYIDFLNRVSTYLTEDMKVFEKIRRTKFYKITIQWSRKVTKLFKGGRITFQEFINLWKMKPEDLEKL